MAAKIIDGVAISTSIRAGLKQRVATLVTKGTRPGLAVIMAGDNPASAVPVGN